MSSRVEFNWNNIIQLPDGYEIRKNECDYTRTLFAIFNEKDIMIGDAFRPDSLDLSERFNEVRKWAKETIENE